MNDNYTQDLKENLDAILDARSESEYAEDHLPGALNWPSLNDEERKLIGTIYKQVSPFEAQKRVLDSQVELATISVDLSSVADAPVETPDTFLSGLAAGWMAFVAFFAGVVVVLGVLVPWIALAAIVSAAAVLVLRKRKAAKIGV